MGEGLPAAVKVYMRDYDLTQEEAFLYWNLFVEKGYLHLQLMQIIKERRSA